MKYLNQLFKTILLITIIIFITMLLKIGLFKILKKEPVKPLYVISKLNYNEKNYDIPVFENKRINNYVMNYIVKNSCENLNYEIFNFKENRLNLYLDCGTEQNYIIDLDNLKELNIRHEIKNWNSFLEKVKELLNLKYPDFVTENADIENGVYNIRKNEIVAKFNTKEFGKISIKINNNEIKSLLNYNAYLDENYKNETFKITPDKKLIAFTYDDGPSIYDKQIVDALKGAHATATFFEVGNRMDDYVDEINYINQNNMEIGNHTFNHKILYELEMKDALNEVLSVNEKYQSITSKSLYIFRPSYGALNENVIDKINMPIVQWSIDTLDWKSRDAKKVYNKIIKNPRDGDIVLMHSLYESTLLATKNSLKDLYKKGFVVVSVSELAKYKSITLENGKIYNCLGCETLNEP